jgi:hypothetical protein
MRLAFEFALGLAALGVAFALVWFGRQRAHTPFMNSGLVFVTYPALVLVFITIGASLIILGLYR